MSALPNSIAVARGFYEPRFTGQNLYERATCRMSVFSAPTDDDDRLVCRKCRAARLYSAIRNDFGATANNQRNIKRHPISILSRSIIRAYISVTQPLFRGRGFDQPRRTIEIAKRNLSLTDTQFRQRSIEIITNVQRAYWDLTFSLRNLQVQRDGVRDAKEQLRHNRRLVEEGQLAPIDIVAAETQVANLELAVYDALEVVNRAENALKNLISENKNDSLWTESLVPTDTVELDAPRTTLPEALGLALQNRPEIELNEVQKTINEIDQRFLREQTDRRLLVAIYLRLELAAAKIRISAVRFRGYSFQPMKRPNNAPTGCGQHSRKRRYNNLFESIGGAERLSLIFSQNKILPSLSVKL